MTLTKKERLGYLKSYSFTPAISYAIPVSWCPVLGTATGLLLWKPLIVYIQFVYSIK